MFEKDANISLVQRLRPAALPSLIRGPSLRATLQPGIIDKCIVRDQKYICGQKPSPQTARQISLLGEGNPIDSHDGLSLSRPKKKV